jgi:hypothetical protein
MGGSESARPTLKIEGVSPFVFISTSNMIIVILKWTRREQEMLKSFDATEEGGESD